MKKIKGKILTYISTKRSNLNSVFFFFYKYFKSIFFCSLSSTQTFYILHFICESLSLHKSKLFHDPLSLDETFFHVNSYNFTSQLNLLIFKFHGISVLRIQSRNVFKVGYWIRFPFFLKCIFLKASSRTKGCVRKTSPYVFSL